MSLEIRKNDSPLNSSISVGTKERETFLIINPNNVYNGFYLLNVHERFPLTRTDKSQSLCGGPGPPPCPGIGTNSERHIGQRRRQVD